MSVARSSDKNFSVVPKKMNETNLKKLKTIVEMRIFPEKTSKFFLSLTSSTVSVITRRGGGHK